MERYEQMTPQQSIQDQNDVYNKLHLEILQFRDSVKDVLAEMQPLKEHLINNISAIIKRAIPQSEVKVYGSHATKLCLPWSDIDIVIITKGGSNDIHYPRSVLSQVHSEL